MNFKIVTLQQRLPVLSRNVVLDTSRNTAILIRQSKRGSDALHYEGRLLQESLIPFVQEAREEDDLEHIHIFDEGAGVSGTKGIDKRNRAASIQSPSHFGISGSIHVAYLIDKICVGFLHCPLKFFQVFVPGEVIDDYPFIRWHNDLYSHLFGKLCKGRDFVEVLITKQAVWSGKHNIPYQIARDLHM